MFLVRPAIYALTAFSMAGQPLIVPSTFLFRFEQPSEGLPPFSRVQNVQAATTLKDTFGTKNQATISPFAIRIDDARAERNEDQLNGTSDGDTATVGHVRSEAESRANIIRIVHHLTDVIGPRLTGSAAAREAALWTVAEMRGWGLTDAHVEPWTFGHPGWRNVRAEGRLLGYYGRPLLFQTVAWTPGTDGPVTGEVVMIDPPRQTDAATLTAYLESVRNDVEGRIVLLGRARDVQPAHASETLDPEIIALIQSGRASPYEPPIRDSDLLTRSQWNGIVDRFFVDARTLMRIDDAARPYGNVGAKANLSFDLAQAVPSIVLSNPDYGRIARLVSEGRLVRLTFDIENVAEPEGRTAYNAVAEIRGTDKADELVILGAHLDSWHVATGAVDNAIGCAVMMEVGRLIKDRGLWPRRTIRIILWSGEEQGLLGSQAYVADHFGTAEDKRPDFEAVAAYLNIDGGSGKIRGANIFGPSEAADMLRDILLPVSELGVEGAIPHGVRRLGSTDATTFSRAGITAIGLIQDPLDYATARHGTLDTYDRLDIDGAEQAVSVAATIALALADRDTMPPRFAPRSMPTPIGPPPTSVEENTTVDDSIPLKP